MKYRNNGSFICDRCRTECKGGCHEKLSELLSGDLTHYSENKEKKEYTPYNEEDGIKPLIDLIGWMGNKINKLIENNK